MTTPATAPAIGTTTGEAAALISALFNNAAPDAGALPRDDEELPATDDGEAGPDPDDIPPREDADGAPEQDTDDAPDPEGDDPDDVPDTGMTTVTLDGKVVRVTVKEAREGYLRTKDYTVKTQAAAEQRRLAAAELSVTQAERQSLTEALTQVRANLDAAAPERPGLDLLDEDPQEYVRQEALFNRHREQTQHIAAAQADLAQRTANDQAKAFNEYVAAEQSLLLEKVPSWKDTKVATKEQASITAFARAEGYSELELAAVTDHRAIAVLRKAMRYDALMAAQKLPKPTQTKPVTPVVRPGVARSVGQASRSDAAFVQARSTGRVNDAAEAIRRSGIVL